MSQTLYMHCFKTVSISLFPSSHIWVRSRNCGCLVTWFCYQLIAKPGNKTAAVSWPDPYVFYMGWNQRNSLISDEEWTHELKHPIATFEWAMGCLLWVVWRKFCYNKTQLKSIVVSELRNIRKCQYSFIYHQNRCINARLQYLQCISNGDTAALHQAIGIFQHMKDY